MQDRCSNYHQTMKPRATATFSPKRKFLKALLPALVLTGAGAAAQEYTPDANTLLLLHFNNSLNGASGETPTTASGVTYEAGIFGNAAYFPSGNAVWYASAGNINSTVGTLEFWIKPRWNGNDGNDHHALRFGDAGGMLFGKDAADNWRSILNRFGAGGNPEIGTAVNVGAEWSAEQWHHTAFTWNSDSVKIYIDGVFRSAAVVTAALPTVSATTFQIGGIDASAYLDGVVDELRLSNVERSPAEIQTGYLNGVTTVSSLTMAPDQFSLYVTWWATPALTAVTNLGTITVPGAAAQWSSSNAAAASVDANGKITANAAGAATITAVYKGQQDQATVAVAAPVLQPTVESIDPFLAAPAAGSRFEIPVVAIRYLPTTDGVNIDQAVADWVGTIADMKTKINGEAVKTKFMLEEGSRFRGYKTPAAEPALGYRVVHIVTVYEPMPPGKYAGTPGVYFPDYNQILTRFGAQNFVVNQGVKEFWVWGYHHGNIAPVESNMSSPLTGDISNSSRFNDDMPIFNKTYTLYNYNFTRSQNENVHNHGHQLESILSYINQLQDGNTNLFWNQFATFGRCGNTHKPPNTNTDYDYENPTLVQSDIEDWTPAGGVTKPVNADTWGNLVYGWPNGAPAAGKTEAQWYIYWMQSMPGIANSIPNGASQMRNWWEFTADWDAAIQSGLRLYGTPPVIAAPSNLTATTVSTSQINLSWADNAGNEFGFKIERKTGAAGMYAEIARVGANVTSYSNTGLAAGTTYYYRVRAYASHGNSAFSNEANANTSGGNPNLALNKPATASSTTSGYPAGNAVDNNLTTHWRSGTVSSTTVVWWRVDLGATYNINNVVINWRGTYYAKKYTVQVSLTGSGWTTVHTDNAGNGGTDNVTFASTAARYVRIRMTQNNTTTERINEVQIYAASTLEKPAIDNADAEEAVVPEEISLAQNYPNPFSASGTFGNPSTKITFGLPQAATVTLKIYNVIGEEVATLVNEQRRAGFHTVVFEANNLPSGIYFAVLKVDAVRRVRRLMLMK